MYIGWVGDCPLKIVFTDGPLWHEQSRRPVQQLKRHAAVLYGV